MQIFEGKIEFLFNRCNEKYFLEGLPRPAFKVFHKKDVFARFECRIGSNGYLTDPVIMVTDRYDFTEEQQISLVMHEMIHYYLAWTKKDKRITHGKEFKKMMDDFNRREGLNIQITYDPRQFVEIKGGGFLKKAVKWLLD